MEDGALWKMVRREGLIAVIPFVLLAAGSFIAVHRLPPGKAYVLESRGIGVFYDFMGALALFGIFGFIYMAPSLWVRRSLGIIYRITFFLIFTVGLCWIEGERIIAVVDDGDSFIFIRRFPLEAIPVRPGGLAMISTRKTGAVAMLNVHAQSWRGIPAGNLECQRVWLEDKRTMQIMDELAAALQSARTQSHKPVAPATPAR